MAVEKRKGDSSESSKFVKRPKIFPSQAATQKSKGYNARRASDSNNDFHTSGKPAGAKAANGSYQKDSRYSSGSKQSSGPRQFRLETSSSEAHAKQRALTQERKANRPNADVIQRSKKIWERLRMKSHVPLAERKELVAELFSIITGRVRDFVFKHDSVRVIQCALKYANQAQRTNIARELRTDVKHLAESRYGKFLVAKMLQSRDEEVRDLIIPEFYGHIKRLINHPEGSWIIDDIYRQVATPQQKATMLREWYGPEFALFDTKKSSGSVTSAATIETADLAKILEASPEKRRPILQHLLQMINGLVQKKMTGFTMLHDAMLQYFLALEPSSAEHVEFLEILKGDIDAESEGGGGDLFRNLAFTRSGSRLVSLALAYGGAKDRKMMLRCFKDTVETMAYDQFGKIVLVVGMDVPDDTKMTSKAIQSELLGASVSDETQRLDRLVAITTNLNARLPMLYPLAGSAKWLIDDTDKAILDEVHQIRLATSKKDPEVRRSELTTLISTPLLELVSKRASTLIQAGFGCHVISEVLLETRGSDKTEAMNVVAQAASGDPASEGHIANNATAGRMLKALVMGGNFDPATQKVKLADPPLEFGLVLYPVIEDTLVDWACGGSSFVVLAFLESEDVPESIKIKVKNALGKGKEQLEQAAKGEESADKKSKKKKGNAGAQMLLERLE